MISHLHQQLLIILKFINKGQVEHCFTEQIVSHLKLLLEGINIPVEGREYYAVLFNEQPDGILANATLQRVVCITQGYSTQQLRETQRVKGT